MQKFASNPPFQRTTVSGPATGALAGPSAATAGVRDSIPVLPMFLAVAAPIQILGWMFFTAGELRLATILSAVAVIVGSLWLLERASRARVRISVKSPLFRSMVFFVAIWIVCTTVVVVTGVRLDADKFVPQTAILLSSVATFFALAAAARHASPNRALMIVCHSIAIIGSVSVVLDAVGITNFETYGTRYFGFLGDGVSWALTFPLILYFTTGRFYYAGAVAVPVLLTASRGPALLIACAMVLLLAFSKNRRFQYALTLMVLGLAVAYQSDQASELLGRFTSTSLTDNDRVLTSLNGIKVFLMSPIWGSGYNALEYYYPDVGNARLLGEFSVATSTAVQMLSEGGILLFLAYVAFVIFATAAAVRILRSSDQESGALMTGLAVWLIAMLWSNQSAAWFLVGSFLTPLVLGASGLVAAFDVRRREQAWLESAMMRPKSGTDLFVTRRQPPAIRLP
jgi:hypothetical protein